MFATPKNLYSIAKNFYFILQHKPLFYIAAKNFYFILQQKPYFVLQPWLLSLLQDATEAFLAAHHSPQACQKMQAFCVGE